VSSATRSFSLLLFMACGEPAPDPPRGDPTGLALRFAIEAEDASPLDALTLRVDELVLFADGPDGAAAVSHSGGDEVSLLPARSRSTTVLLELAPGRYRDVHTLAHLRPSGARPAVEATGTYEGQPLELIVSMEVGLEGAVGELELVAGEPVALTYLLHPDAWLHDLDDAEPTGDRLLIDASHNVPLYFELVDTLEESTDVVLGGPDP